jgi:hypothetical protein
METDVTLQISKLNYLMQILALSSTRIFYMLSFYLIIILFMIGPFKLKFTLTRSLSSYKDFCINIECKDEKENSTNHR